MGGVLTFSPSKSVTFPVSQAVGPKYTAEGIYQAGGGLGGVGVGGSGGLGCVCEVRHVTCGRHGRRGVMMMKLQRKTQSGY